MTLVTKTLSLRRVESLCSPHEAAAAAHIQGPSFLFILEMWVNYIFQLFLRAVYACICKFSLLELKSQQVK